MTIFTDKVINVSKGEQQQCIKKKFSKKSMSIQIYNGIRPLQKTKPELEENYKNTFVVTTLSRFDIQKNMRMMYEIAARVKTYQDIRFIFIGDGDDKAALENKAKKEGLKNISTYERI